MKSYPLIAMGLWVTMACHTYQPLSKDLPVGSNLEEKNEILENKLSKISPDTKLEVESISGKKLRVKFQSYSQDTLYADYDMPNNKFSVKMPLNDISEIKVDKVNGPLTAFAVGVGLTGLILAIHDVKNSSYHLYGNWTW